MKPYIDYNTEKRKNAVGTFANDFYTRMTNSVLARLWRMSANIVNIKSLQMVKNCENIQG